MFTRRRIYIAILCAVIIVIWIILNIALKEYVTKPYNIDRPYLTYFNVVAGGLAVNFARLYIKSDAFTRLVEMELTRAMLVRVGFAVVGAIAILVAISR